MAIPRRTPEEREELVASLRAALSNYAAEKIPDSVNKGRSNFYLCIVKIKLILLLGLDTISGSQCVGYRKF